MSGELLSIIIPSLNEERHIGMALRSIKDQDYKLVEVILVDSFSKDRTREIAREYGVQIVDYPGRVLGARLEGLKRSTGQWVMFIDADQVLQPNAISRCVEQIRSMTWWSSGNVPTIPPTGSSVVWTVKGGSWRAKR